jgi:catechol 2,3-dioxygenase-like lactoylglutathione lyase family enzyme
MATALALDHIVLVADNVDETLAWYDRHAGLDGVRIEEWRRGEAPFPSLRVDASTIIDVVPHGRDDGTGRGHLDHICFVVSEADRRALADELEVIDAGTRYGARGDGESIYVRDPDGLMVEFRSYPSR